MMHKKISHVLQKLADLPGPTYERVAEELMQEFLIPQPSLAATLQAIRPSAPSTAPTKAKRPRGRPVAKQGGESKAGAVRALLTAEGPKTTAEIAERAGVPATHIHPLLASIGAKPMGVVQDKDGDERKIYGLPGAMVRDETVQPIL